MIESYRQFKSTYPVAFDIEHPALPGGRLTISPETTVPIHIEVYHDVAHFLQGKGLMVDQPHTKQDSPPIQCVSVVGLTMREIRAAGKERGITITVGTTKEAAYALVFGDAVPPQEQEHSDET